MTESMLERVARAICKQQNLDPDKLIDLPHPSGVGIKRVHTWRMGIPVARAAIEAMREPTVGMADAGHQGEVDLSDDDPTPIRVWRAMLAAALEEGGGDADPT